MESEKELYRISLFEGYNKKKCILEKTSHCNFTTKELLDFLKYELAESNAGDIVKVKKEYALLLSMLIDGVFA